jgi:hypothetical protein
MISHGPYRCFMGVRHFWLLGFILLILILRLDTGSCANAQLEESTLTEAVLGNWPVYKLRAKAFDNLKLYYHPAEKPVPQDPAYLENRKAMAQNKGVFENREILMTEPDGSYCVLNKNKTVVSYLSSGKTIAFGFVDQNAFPYRLALYEYPSGKLRSIFLNFSPQDKFKFNAAGELVSGSVDKSLWERPNLEKKVVQVGQKLLRDNHIKEAISFHIISDRQETNAYAGEDFNTIFITKGLLAYVESDDELAAVLAHEVSHIILRHRMEYPDETKTDKLLQRFLKLSVEPPQDSIQFDRQQQKELDADRFGLRLITKSGYKPEAMVSVMQKIVTDGSQVWRTHPMGSHRLKAMQRQINFSQNSGATGEVESSEPDPLQVSDLDASTIILHQWTVDQARLEVLKHSQLQSGLAEATRSFPTQDPQYDFHLSAIQAHKALPGKTLLYHEAVGLYSELLQGTQAGPGSYAVQYPATQAYSSYHLDGSRYQTVLCNQAKLPRTCYAMTDAPGPFLNMMFQVTETDGFRFTQNGDLLGFTRDSKIYDAHGMLIGKISHY